MGFIRPRVALVAVVWLLSHVATVGLAFAGLCCDMPVASEAAGEDDACCKGLAPGQMCPLHKHSSHQSARSAPSPQNSEDCVMRSGCDQASMMAAAVALDLGLLPPVGSVSDLATATTLAIETAASLARSVLPDFPPPGA